MPVIRPVTIAIAIFSQFLSQNDEASDLCFGITIVYFCLQRKRPNRRGKKDKENNKKAPIDWNFGGKSLATKKGANIGRAR